MLHGGPTSAVQRQSMSLPDARISSLVLTSRERIAYRPRTGKLGTLGHRGMLTRGKPGMKEYHLKGLRMPQGVLRESQTQYAWSMGKRVAVVIYVLALVGVVVGVDVLFLKHHTLLRLIVNIGIVLVFAAFYLRFLRRVLQSK